MWVRTVNAEHHAVAALQGNLQTLVNAPAKLVALLNPWTLGLRAMRLLHPRASQPCQINLPACSSLNIRGNPRTDLNLLPGLLLLFLLLGVVPFKPLQALQLHWRRHVLRPFHSRV